MKRWRLALALAVCLTVARVGNVHADCNQFQTIQSIIMSEATRQPLAAQIEVARVAVTHGACNLDGNFYTGYAVALRARDRQDFSNHHYRSYFNLYSLDSSVRESAAVAAHAALTESPPVPRYHFDAANAPLAWWWNAPRACPDGYWTVAELRIC